MILYFLNQPAASTLSQCQHVHILFFYYDPMTTAEGKKTYLEMLSGEHADMLVSILSELSKLNVSKAWSL